MDRCYAKLTLQQLHSVPVLHEGVDPDHRRHEEDPRHADVEAREGDLRRRQEAARVPLRHIHLQSVRVGRQLTCTAERHALRHARVLTASEYGSLIPGTRFLQ